MPCSTSLQADQAPRVAIDLDAVVRRALLHHIPVQREDVEAGGGGRADREQAVSVAPGEPRPRRRSDSRDRDLGVRVGVRPQVQPCVAQGPAAVLERHRLVAAHQARDDVDRVLKQLAGLRHVEADHRGVARQRARPQAEHEAPLGHVVELHGALGDPQRVVVARADHAAAELDGARALCRGRDEDLGRRDDLGAGRVVLADPRLVVAQAIEVIDQVEVAVDEHGRVDASRVKRRHEDSEAHTRHDGPPGSVDDERSRTRRRMQGC
jgi:hypothetical protein